MSKCVNHEMGQLLHAFELGQLEGEQRDAFEVHLLACDHCFMAFSKFDPVAHLLRSDKDVRELVDSEIRRGRVVPESEPLLARLKAFLWPEAPFLLRPAVSYFLVMLLAVPAYMGIRGGQEPGVQGVQSLLLTGTRSVTGQEADASAPLVIVFRVDGAAPGDEFRVAVRSEAGDVIYSDDRFDKIGERELATLLLPAGSLLPGRYHIDVFALGESTPLVQYVFDAR